MLVASVLLAASLLLLEPPMVCARPRSDKRRIRPMLRIGWSGSRDSSRPSHASARE